MVLVDGWTIAVIGIADAVRPTAAAAVAALSELGVEVAILSGEPATAQRIGAQLGVTTVIAEVLPGDKAGEVKELMGAGRRVAIVGDGVNDAPALAQADLGVAIGAGTGLMLRPEIASITMAGSSALVATDAFTAQMALTAPIQIGRACFSAAQRTIQRASRRVSRVPAVPERPT